MEPSRHRVPAAAALLVLVAVAAVVGRCGAQLPIPVRTDGFLYGGKSAAPAWGDAVVVEAFFAPVCPDSRDAWPPLPPSPFLSCCIGSIVLDSWYLSQSGSSTSIGFYILVANSAVACFGQYK